MQYLTENYPNPDLFLEADGYLENSPDIIMALLHPARAKLMRLQAIIEYIKYISKPIFRQLLPIEFFREQKFDAVFLQSVWYKQDYDLIKTALEDLYWVSKFDKNCPSVEQEDGDHQVLVGCNGLMTLAIKETCSGKTGIIDEKLMELDKGTPEEAAAETEITLYFYYVFGKKVQIIDLWYNEKVVRLVNVAFAPTSDNPLFWAEDQNRDLRVKQACTVCNAVKSPGFYDVAILAAGLNDMPDSEPYEELIKCGFTDALE